MKVQYWLPDGTNGVTDVELGSADNRRFIVEAGSPLLTIPIGTVFEIQETLDGYFQAVPASIDNLWIQPEPGPKRKVLLKEIVDPESGRFNIYLDRAS